MNETKFIKTLTTRYFGVKEHLIWKLGLEETDIQTPEGYSEIKTDTTRVGKQIYIRKFFKRWLYENN